MGCTSSSVSTPAPAPASLPPAQAKANEANTVAAPVKTEEIERGEVTTVSNSTPATEEPKPVAPPSPTQAAVPEPEDTEEKVEEEEKADDPSPAENSSQTDESAAVEETAEAAVAAAEEEEEPKEQDEATEQPNDDEDDVVVEDVNDEDGQSTSAEPSFTVVKKPAPGAEDGVDFQKMLLDTRVQELLASGKTDEEKLFSLFTIYDEDNDGLLSEKEVNDVVWMTEAAHTHTHSPVKDSEPQGAPTPLSLSLATEPAPQPAAGSEQSYVDSPAGSAPATPFVVDDALPAVSLTAELESAVEEDKEEQSATTASLPPAPTRAAGPANRKPKKLVHTPIGASPASPSGTLDDFTENVASSSPAPSVSQSATNTPNGTQVPMALARKKAERRVSEVADLNIPAELVPPQKKGFLRVNVFPASSKVNKFHVLDAGVLYHLDSATSSAFSMDRKGISLQDRVLSTSDEQPNVITLVRPAGFVSKEEGDTAVVEIGIRGNNSEERDDWLEAIQKHIAFAQVLQTYRKNT